MKLFELMADDITNAYYDPNNDKINGRSLGDTRKTKLMLRDINKLKKMRAVRKLDDLQHQDLLAIMYGQPEGDPNGGAMPF